MERRELHDLGGQCQRAQLALRRERDPVADRVGAVGEAFGHLLDLRAAEGGGRPARGVLVGRGQHHPGAAEPGDGLGAVPAVEVAERGDHLDAEHEAAAELARFGEPGLERGHLVEGGELVEHDPHPAPVVLVEGQAAR